MRQKYTNVALKMHNRVVKQKVKHTLLTQNDCATINVVDVNGTSITRNEAYQPLAPVPMLSYRFLKNIKEAAPKLSTALTDLAKELDANELNAEEVEQHLAEVKDPVPIKTKKRYKTVYFKKLDL